MRRSTIPSHLGDAFTVADALDSGVPYCRLRGRDLRIPFPGIRRFEGSPAPVDPASSLSHRPSAQVSRILGLARSYFLMERPPDLFLSHTTAALLLGLPVHSRYLFEDAIEISRMPPAKAPRGRRVRGHLVCAENVRRITRAGLPTSDPASTWGMLAARLPARELVAIGDALIRIPRIPGAPPRPDARGLATLDELHAVARRRGARGVTRLRAALQLIRPGASSRPESLLRLELDRPGMPAPELDFDVFDRGGRLLGCSEIAYPEFRVAIEYESAHHRVDSAQWNRDLQKYADYADAGWAVVRITARHLFTMPGEPLRLVRGALMRARADARGVEFPRIAHQGAHHSQPGGTRREEADVKSAARTVR